MAEQELRSTVREILLLEGDMEHLERQTTGLHDRCVAVAKENAELHFLICNEEEKACMALERFNTYRKKMEGHRAAVLHTARQTEAHQGLEEKRTLVQKLRQKIEDLNQDLNNPNGNTVEIYALKEKISMTKKDIAEKRKRLQEEHETHTQIKRDIAVRQRENYLSQGGRLYNNNQPDTYTFILRGMSESQ
uniref:Uncharacterized protein n=1 Tax=Echeneis naucrates TaxID=173247 RepID=A0A665X3Y9_ECHNA